MISDVDTYVGSLHGYVMTVTVTVAVTMVTVTVMRVMRMTVVATVMATVMTAVEIVTTSTNTSTTVHSARALACMVVGSVAANNYANSSTNGVWVWMRNQDLTRHGTDSRER